MIPVLVCLASVAPHGFHAVLISYASPADQSPVNDCQLMTEALVRSGWGRSEIAYYDGNLENGSLSFLAKEVSEARNGKLLVYVSGSATPEPRTLTAAMGTYWKWGELMGVLVKGGEVALLADSGHANLQQSWIAPNVTSLVEDATWRDVAQKRHVGTVIHNGRTMQVGTLTYILSRELPFSADMRTLAYRINKTLDSGSMAAIWADLRRVKVIGKRNLSL